MAIEDAVKDLSKRVGELRDYTMSEEATKMAFVVPFIQEVLGYDVLDPREVVPEFTADVGIKKGERVDYAIVVDGEPRILIEAKRIGERLSPAHASQLTRYFAMTDVDFAILTNGSRYEVYTHTQKENLMDGIPFLVLDLMSPDGDMVEMVKMLTKSRFAPRELRREAERLITVQVMREAIADEFENPSPEMVKLIAKRTTDRVMTPKAVEEYTEIFGYVASEYIQGLVDDEIQRRQSEEIRKNNRVLYNSDKIVTTDEEVLSFNIVQAIGSAVVPVDRIVMRDVQSYCSILYRDDTSRPIVRLYYDRRSPYMTMTGADGEEERVQISKPTDIYAYKDAIRDRIRYLVSQESQEQ